MKNSIAQKIDYTILKPTVSEGEIEKTCMTAIKRHYYSVCSYPIYAQRLYKFLKNTNVKVCTVHNFPNGQCRGSAISAEIQGEFEYVDEFDVVLPFYFIANNHINEFNKWCKSLRKSCEDKIVKIIIEISLLNEYQIREICEILIKNKIDFVKTSTGFGNRKTYVTDITLLKKICGNRIKIKAAGGIKDLKTAEWMMQLGADRIGTSADLLK
jgi:deoxyribose-phosphate aldolase